MPNAVRRAGGRAEGRRCGKVRAVRVRVPAGAVLPTRRRCFHGWRIRRGNGFHLLGQRRALSDTCGAWHPSRRRDWFRGWRPERVRGERDVWEIRAKRPPCVPARHVQAREHGCGPRRSPALRDGFHRLAAPRADRGAYKRIFSGKVGSCVLPVAATSYACHCVRCSR